MNYADIREQYLLNLHYLLEQSLKLDYQNDSWKDDVQSTLITMYKFNLYHWITLMFQGINPHKTSIKRELEKLKYNMMAYERKYPSSDPQALRTILSMYYTIYVL